MGGRKVFQMRSDQMGVRPLVYVYDMPRAFTSGVLTQLPEPHNGPNCMHRGVDPATNTNYGHGRYYYTHKSIL
eukprot:3433420-Pyramimonas_sp.AAC.1